MYRITIEEYDIDDESTKHCFQTETECATWPELTEYFLRGLQGMGFVYSMTPHEMAEELVEYNKEHFNIAR